jgi:Fe2+ or Zn2+ uptake regulation protein
VRFDARTTEHHHLACRRCGQVVDLEVAVDAAPALAAARAAGLHAERAEVVVQGLCAGCSAELTPARS